MKRSKKKRAAKAAGKRRTAGRQGAAKKRVTKKRVTAKRAPARKRAAAKKRAPARKRAAAKKRVAARKRAPARKQAAAKKRTPAKKRAPARKPAPAKKPASAKRRSVSPGPSTKRKSAATPLALVRETAPRPGAALAAGAGGSEARDRMLLELIRARTDVLAAIDDLDAAAANRPMDEGKWSVRQVVIHLAARDRARLREMENVLLGHPASWWAYDEDDTNRDNAETVAASDHLSWPEAIEHLRTTRQELLEALESIPDDRAEVWTPEHPFGRMIRRLPEHDLHHAEAIRDWRQAHRL